MSQVCAYSLLEKSKPAVMDTDYVSQLWFRQESGQTQIRDAHSEKTPGPPRDGEYPCLCSVLRGPRTTFKQGRQVGEAAGPEVGLSLH